MKDNGYNGCDHNEWCVTRYSKYPIINTQWKYFEFGIVHSRMPLYVKDLFNHLLLWHMSAHRIPYNMKYLDETYDCIRKHNTTTDFFYRNSRYDDFIVRRGAFDSDPWNRKFPAYKGGKHEQRLDGYECVPARCYVGTVEKVGFYIISTSVQRRMTYCVDFIDTDWVMTASGY